MALIVILMLVLALGALLGLVAFFQLGELRRELAQLRRALLAAEFHPPPEPQPKPEPQPEASAARPAEPQSAAHVPEPACAAPAAEWDAPPQWRAPSPWRTESRLWRRLRENWMVWLGGGCVALAGIFLVRYGVEQGMLGPRARVLMGLATALALHIGAEWLRRRTGGAHPAFAAMAGGGSITAFAAILSALHLYQLISPGLAFALLALTGVVTMWLARVQGPALAVIGMLGAYSVPLLVSTGGGNLLATLVYSLIISGSVLLLLRGVYRPWLWCGLLAGGLGWWLISLAGTQPDGWRGLYLTAFAYGLLAVIPGDWLLRRGDEGGHAERWLPLGLALVVLAQCVSVVREGFDGAAFWTWSPLALLLLWAARRRPNLAFAPGLLLIGQGAAWLLNRLDYGERSFSLLPWPAELQGGFLLFLLASAALYSAAALLNLRRGGAAFWWASLATMAPLLALSLGYLLAGDYLPPGRWSLIAAALGAVFVYLASRGALRAWSRELVVWLFAAGHFGYSLAVCLWLERAGLTLALALQAVSLAWIIRRFRVPELGWVLKIVLAVVVIRLTLNPWLASYGADTHWILWTYGGATLCAALAARMLSGWAPLARWAEAAALHLLVLTLWAQGRYWLYGGQVFAWEFSFREAVLNLWLFASLGMVYYRRSLVSAGLAAWYRAYGRLLILGALASYAAILLATLADSPWAWGAVGSRPLWNLVLPAYAGPALLAWLASRYYEPALCKAAGLLAAGAGFIWVNMEIRHLWQGHIRLYTPAGTGELYTYSAVWLSLAAAAILLGSWRGWRNCYRGGMALLALVIAKIFLLDMSDLAGLLRVASFMGLGLALLGIAFLHQRLRLDSQRSFG